MVEYVTYKKEKYAVRVSYYALKMTKAETGKDIDLLDSDFTLLEPLFYYSLEAGCKMTNKVFDIKREDIPFMLDECWMEFTQVIMKFFPTGEPTGEKKRK